MKRINSRKAFFLSLSLITIIIPYSFMNHKDIQQNHRPTKWKELSVISYNVENLFDTIDNPLTDDDEFLPTAERHWTKQRYHKKLQHIASVVSRAGGTIDFPSFVGLIEVENNEVLEDLIHRTDLSNAKYQYLISHSPDRRGIDVALLYRPEVFTVIGHNEIEISFPSNLEKRSRNILHVEGKLYNQETLYLFVCHSPSRREGAKKTQAYRNTVMRELKRACQDLYNENPNSHILIMGDFNAPPSEVNHSKALGSKNLSYRYSKKHSDSKELILFNIMNQIPKDNPAGSYCYRGRWDQLDQFIISQSLLKEDSSLQYIDRSVRNYAPRYLQRNKRFASGFRVPWRTYLGPHYIGGYSDHYPITMKLQIKN